MPSAYSQSVMDGKSGPLRIALKIHPSETLALADAHWQIHIEQDLRIPALVSVLKAAHLTLFDMLEYRYALSPGGHFLGRAVLGEFLLAKVDRPRPEVLANVTPYFRESAHIVRPVLGTPATFNGTAGDRIVYVCKSGELAWSLIVFVRTSHSLHAALVPAFQEPGGAHRSFDFLRGPDERIQAHFTRFEGDHWMSVKDPVVLSWPKTGVLYPDE